MTPNELELTLWLSGSTIFNIIFFLIIRGYDKECRELIKLLTEAIRIGKESLNTSKKWEDLYNRVKN